MKTFKLELVPEVKLVVGEEEYILAIDNHAIKKWEEVSGKDMMVAGEVPETAPEVITLFWAAALKHHPEITQEDIDHILHPGNLAQVAEVLTELLSVSMPKPEGGEAKN